MATRAHRRRGFSILELAIVLATVSVLTSIAIPNLTASFKRARSVEALQTIAAIERAMVEYYNRNGEYPRDPGVSNPTSTGYARAQMDLSLAGWKELGFKPDAWYRYRYSFEPALDASGRAMGVTIIAQADTDDDGNIGRVVKTYKEGFDVTDPLLSSEAD